MTVCAAATSSAAEPGEARPIRNAIIKTSARMQMPPMDGGCDGAIELNLYAHEAGRKWLSAERQTPLAGSGQAELTEPSHRVADADQALPVQLWNFLLRFALADLDQGRELLGAQGGMRVR